MGGRGAVGPGLGLLVGVLAVQWLPGLPATAWCVALLALGVLLGCLGRRTRWLGWCVLGIGWACLRGGMAMEARLPHELEGKDVWVEGRVSGLPLAREDATGFTLSIARATFDNAPLALHGLIRVNWYRSAPAVAPCTHWRLRLRLKRPRGLINPGGSDSERSALDRGIVATGYVREDPGNERLAHSAWCIDGVRDAISRSIAQRVADPHDATLLQAFPLATSVA